MVLRELLDREALMMETLNRHFREIALAAFQRHGFASAELAAQWPAIAGDSVAAMSAPGKISWPRANDKSAQKQGGTLTLNAAHGRALELQYATPRIIERVNQFLGYRAITAIKVIQSDFAPQVQRNVAAPLPSPAWEESLAGIEEPELQSALRRMAAHAAPKGPSKKSFSTGENRVLSQQLTSSRTVS
jgi:hypothetical protein